MEVSGVTHCECLSVFCYGLQAVGEGGLLWFSSPFSNNSLLLLIFVKQILAIITEHIQYARHCCKHFMWIN